MRRMGVRNALAGRRWRVRRRCPSDSGAAVLPPCIAVVAVAAAEQPKEGGMGRTLTLALLFGLWYAFNIQFNM
jgi:hypothetical protein